MIWLAPLLTALVLEVARVSVGRGGAPPEQDDDRWVRVDASSQLRWLEERLPESFWSSIRLEAQGLELGFETRRSSDEVFVQVYRDGRRVGYVYAGRESAEDVLHEEPREALWMLESALGIDIPTVWVVRRSSLDYDLHGLGIGLLTYLLACATVGAAGGGVIVPDEAAEGETSSQAIRVWRTLATLFPGSNPEALVLFLPGPRPARIADQAQ